MDALPSEEPVPAPIPSPGPKWRRWTKQEDFALINGWTHGYDYLTSRLGRSRQAIQHRVRILGFHSLRQGVWSLLRICRETGYNWKQVYRARDALGQKWCRTSKRGIRKRADKRGGSHYRISDEQVEAIVEYLGKEKHHYEGVWSVKYGSHCLVCGKSDRPHAFKGRCTRCYSKEKQVILRGDPVRLEKQRRWHRESQRRRRAKSNEYVRNRRKMDPAFREKLRERGWWRRVRRSKRLQDLLSALLLVNLYGAR